MIKVDVSGLDKVMATVAGMGKQVRFATAAALTRTAYAVMTEQKRMLPGELDRPKSTTTSGMRYVRATKDKLTAEVRFNRRGEGVPVGEFISHNIIGGRRGVKRSELMLRAAGILPAGMQTVPGVAAKFDAYGNMQRGQIVSILSYFRTFGLVKRFDGDRAGGSWGSGDKNLINTGRMNRAKNKSRSQYEYFVVKPGSKLPAGIWLRTKTQAKPLLMFVTPGQYRRLVKFHETGARVVRRDFNALFDKAFADAMRSAR